MKLRTELYRALLAVNRSHSIQCRQSRREDAGNE